MIFYAGDTHGRVDAIKSIDAIAEHHDVKTIVQVGDFGCHFETPGCPVDKYFRERASGPTWYTCGGNHDNWDYWEALSEEQKTNVVELSKGCFYVRRGSLIDLEGKTHLFFGGAESTDRHMRTENLDWWSKETPTREEFYTFFDALESGRPDVVVTHDAPSSVEIRRSERDAAPTPNGLYNALKNSEFKPKTWVFGHHHRVQTWTVEDTKFICCGLHGQFVTL